MALQHDINTHTQHLTPFTTSTNISTTRQKRFLSLLLARTAVIASTFLGAWNTLEIHQLKSANHELVVKMGDIIRQQTADEAHLSLIDRVINTLHQDLQQFQLDHTHQQFIDQTTRQLQVVQTEILQITQVLDGLMER